MSHSSSFLVLREVPFSISSVLFMVLGAAQRGAPVHPWIPLWIHHCLGKTLTSSCRNQYIPLGMAFDIFHFLNYLNAYQSRSFKEPAIVGLLAVHFIYRHPRPAQIG